MSTLAEKAAALAQPESTETPGEPPFDVPVVPVQPPPAPAPAQYATPDDVPVHVAWQRVMQDVPAVGKDRETTEGPRYTYRGVDDVINAFSAAIRRHGVIIGPGKVTPTYTSSQAKSGTKMRECTIVVDWWVMGPRGDVLNQPIQSAGEAMDYQDKSTSKAESVAMRVLMTTLGFVGTQAPDPEADSAGMERVDDATPTPQGYFAEITNPMTPRERFRQLYNELGQYRLVEFLVEHEGEPMTLGQLFMRTVNTRWPRQAPETPTVPTAEAAEVAHIDHPVNVWAEGCPGCAAKSAAIDRAAEEPAP